MQNSLENLINIFSKLPGLGKRSAQRIVLHLIEKKDKVIPLLTSSLEKALRELRTCEVCHNLDYSSPCNICCDKSREQRQIAIVETVAELWAFERSKVFKGLYHILGGAISAKDGKTPENLNITSLQNRINNGVIKEMIIATNATIEGQITAHYLAELFKKHEIEITRLGYGMPVGGELDYLDEGTIMAALKQRQNVL